jgi:lysophospholipase L1-like esterase
MRLRHLLLAAGVAMLVAAAGPAEMPAPQSKPAWMERHQLKLAEIRGSAPAVIFVGDSIIHELENRAQKFGDINGVWRRYYACRNAVNLGFAGDTTGNVLWRLANGEIDGIHPKLAVVLIGTNDISPRGAATPEDTAAGVQAVAGALHQRLPGTRILVLGLLPRGRGDARRQAVNTLLSRVDWSGYGAVYRNVEQAMLKNGAPDAALYRESEIGWPLLHPNAAGWAAIASAIEPDVSALLKDHRGVPPCGA